MTHAKKIFNDMFGEFEDMSELVDAAIDRVDLVGKAANGHRFILAKSDSTNLIPASMVRDFITKANEEDMPTDVNDAEVAKADLDANVILEDAVVDGDVEEEGSAAWESVDAETAAKWTAILGRAKIAISELKERESAELAAGVEDDVDGYLSLDEACEAIGYAISNLAAYAANEAAEVDAEVMAGIEKSVAAIDIESLTTIEDFAEVIKAGRALSSANEGTLRSAVESIMKVLDSLPVAKAEIVAEEVIPETVEKDRLAEIINMAADSAEVVIKADLTGSTDNELARIALTGADAERTAALQEIGLRFLTAHMEHEAEETPAEEAVEEAADEDEVAEIEELPSEDAAVEEELTPAPANEVGTSADEVTKSHESEQLVEAKMVETLVKEARDEESGRNAAIIKSLEDRIATLEAPAPSRVLTNGALPPAHLMRGQDAGASLMADASILRKQVEDAPDAVTKSNAQEVMRIAALEALTALRNR